MAQFFSIGSNDLTQYVTAAARDNAAVAGLAESALSGGRHADRRADGICGAAGDRAVSSAAISPASVGNVPDLIGRGLSGSFGGAGGTGRGSRRPSADPGGRWRLSEFEDPSSIAVGRRGSRIQDHSSRRSSMRARPARGSAWRWRWARTAASCRRLPTRNMQRRSRSRHLETIFDLCHFPAAARARFLDAYARPIRSAGMQDRSGLKMRRQVLALPDLGDAERNARFDALIMDFARKVCRVLTGTE